MTNQEERFPEAKKTITNNYIEEVLKEFDCKTKGFEAEVHEYNQQQQDKSTSDFVEETYDRHLFCKGTYNELMLDLSLSKTKLFLKKALQKQQDIIKECLPKRVDFSSTGYEKQFLDNLSKRGINLE